MQTSTDLKNLLKRIDHKGYPAYKDTKGMYQFPGYVLSIDHVQGDPFASPSKVSVHVKGAAAGFPKELYCGDCQRIALQYDLTRRCRKACVSGERFREERADLGEPLRAGSVGEDCLPDRRKKRGCGTAHGDWFSGKWSDDQCPGTGKDLI